MVKSDDSSKLSPQRLDWDVPNREVRLLTRARDHIGKEAYKS